MLHDFSVLLSNCWWFVTDPIEQNALYAFVQQFCVRRKSWKAEDIHSCSLKINHSFFEIREQNLAVEEHKLCIYISISTLHFEHRGENKESLLLSIHEVLCSCSGFLSVYCNKSTINCG